MSELMERYFTIKNMAERNVLLKQLVNQPPEDAKEFFLKAFKKERFLDMKLTALRGYAAYASEEEVIPLMGKLLETLKKRPEKTPYNYQEYEPMRSVFLLPYLIDRYDYECFRVFADQLEKQYAAMPDCFKNIYTLDEQGNARNLRDPREVDEAILAFLGQ